MYLLKSKTWNFSLNSFVQFTFQSCTTKDTNHMLIPAIIVIKHQYLLFNLKTVCVEFACSPFWRISFRCCSLPNQKHAQKGNPTDEWFCMSSGSTPGLSRTHKCGQLLSLSVCHHHFTSPAPTLTSRSIPHEQQLLVRVEQPPSIPLCPPRKQNARCRLPRSPTWHLRADPAVA